MDEQHEEKIDIQDERSNNPTGEDINRGGNGGMGRSISTEPVQPEEGMSQNVSECPDLEGLSKKQRRAIPILIQTKSKTAMCEEAGISIRTLSRWMTQEAFKTEYNRQRDEVVQGALDRMKIALTPAVDTLINVMSDDRESSNVRVRCAEDIIDHIVDDRKFKENEDIEKRLEALEKMKDRKSRRTNHEEEDEN
jgi:phage terminase small subunit